MLADSPGPSDLLVRSGGKFSVEQWKRQREAARWGLVQAAARAGVPVRRLGAAHVLRRSAPVTATTHQKISATVDLSRRSYVQWLQRLGVEEPKRPL